MAEQSAKKTRRRSMVFLITSLVLVGILAFSVYQFLSEYIPQQREQSRFDELRDLIGEDEYDDTPVTDTTDSSEKPIVKQSKYKKLFSLNPDMRGWLSIKDTAIDYPVMKSELEQGEYYLHRDFDGYYSFAGCLFIGQNCDEDSGVFVIYGHNMNNGSMFGDLDNYAYYDYALKHKDILFDTENERRVYRVFAAFRTQVYEEDVAAFKYYEEVGDRTEEDYRQLVYNLYYQSSIDLGELPEYPAQIMMLSTCAYHTEFGRFVVAAYRIK